MNTIKHPITIESIPANIMRAAQHCQAKQDTRYYLNGIFISTDNRIAGSNGHVLFVSDFDSENPKRDHDLIIQFDGKIPGNANFIDLYLYSDEHGIAVCRKTHKTVKKLAVTVIDGIYPNYQKVIEKLKPERVKRYGMNAKYLKLIADVFPTTRSHGESVAVTFSGADNAITLNPASHDFPENTRLYIMPIRLETEQ